MHCTECAAKSVASSLVSLHFSCSAIGDLRSVCTCMYAACIYVCLRHVLMCSALPHRCSHCHRPKDARYIGPGRIGEVLSVLQVCLRAIALARHRQLRMANEVLLATYGTTQETGSSSSCLFLHSSSDDATDEEGEGRHCQEEGQ